MKQAVLCLLITSITIIYGAFILPIILRDNGSAPPVTNGFEHGRGFITVGCAFLNLLDVEPYSADNRRTGVVVFGLSGDNTTGKKMSLIIDGPMGLVTVVGYGCDTSVDWSGLPEENR